MGTGFQRQSLLQQGLLEEKGAHQADDNKSMWSQLSARTLPGSSDRTRAVRRPTVNLLSGKTDSDLTPRKTYRATEEKAKEKNSLRTRLTNGTLHCVNEADTLSVDGVHTD